jgi:hypothetical protein
MKWLLLNPFWWLFAITMAIFQYVLFPLVLGPLLFLMAVATWNFETLRNIFHDFYTDGPLQAMIDALE